MTIGITVTTGGDDFTFENNRVFGAGNKVLHNVVGTIGVLEGNAGDLKVGLPWQSVHDGQDYRHAAATAAADAAGRRDHRL